MFSKAPICCPECGHREILIEEVYGGTKYSCIKCSWNVFESKKKEGTKSGTVHLI
jgi:hypothetical protein